MRAHGLAASAVAACFVMLPAATLGAGAGTEAHFHPKGKPPSAFTVESQERARATLPFGDQRDFDESKRGFVAAPPYKQIMAEAGNVAWDMGSYEWLLQDRRFDSIHPSLQRLAVLNMAYGLYEVVPGRVWQVRGFDLANISFIKGDTGWIVFDVLTAKETAAAALQLVNDTLGERPVVAVVYSHSHADHFGGIRGIVDEADVKSGKVPILAPVGFMEHAIAENVYAGTAMTRRLFYQYGILLPYSRVQESEADILGLDLMAKAGFDPRESVKLWFNMGKAGGGQPPEFLSTHPSDRTRISGLNAHMAVALNLQNQARQAGKQPACR